MKKLIPFLMIFFAFHLLAQSMKSLENEPMPPSGTKYSDAQLEEMNRKEDLRIREEWDKKEQEAQKFEERKKMRDEQKAEE